MATKQLTDDDTRYKDETEYVPHGVYKLTETALADGTVVFDIENDVCFNAADPQHTIMRPSWRINRSMQEKQLVLVKLVEPETNETETDETENQEMFVFERLVGKKVIDMLTVPVGDVAKKNAKQIIIKTADGERTLKADDGWQEKK